MYSILILGSVVLATICAGLYLNLRSCRHEFNGAKARRVVFSALVFLLVILCLSVIPVFAAETADPAASSASVYRYIGASLAVGLACIGAGIAVGYVGAAALGIVGEKPSMMGMTFIYLGLAEGIAIYGIVFGILILLGM